MDTILTDTDQLNKLYESAIANGHAIVTYRVPHQDQSTTLIQFSSQPKKLTNLQSIEKKRGFLFAPFDTHSKFPVRFLEPDRILHDLYPIDLPDYNARDENLNKHPNGRSSKYITTKKEFGFQIEETKKHIRDAKINKLVLSRISAEKKPEDFPYGNLYESLQNKYPSAFVYMLYIKDTGLWIGASPEPLLFIDGNRASTVSLAGTRHYRKNNDQKWGDKELDEQEIVTTYIEDVIRKYAGDDFEKTGPESYKAASIEHLRTSFTFPASSVLGKTDSFLSELHPTPSVCGLPRDTAMSLINEIEKHDREYYAGFLGPVNLENQWKIYMNLRCMKVDESNLYYYTGAGITSGSDSDKEWEETISKQSTMGSIVKSLNTI